MTKTATRKLAAGMIVSAIAASTLLRCASSRPQHSVAGSWELIAFEQQAGAGESVLGPDPIGFIVYDSHGHVSAQLMRRDRPDAGKAQTSAKPGGTTAVNGYVAYFGTYSVDWRTSVITHHIRGAVAPADVGRELTRRFRFEGETLVLEIGTGASLRILKWRRVSP